MVNHATNIPDPYATLNLPHSATAVQIKKSYRQLARKYHPDTWSQPCFSEADRQEATDKFTSISNAFALLSDAAEKAEYDRTFRLGGYDHCQDRQPNNRSTSSNPTRNNTPRAQANPPPRRPPPPPKLSAQQEQQHWATAIDPKSGSTYFYNKATGVSSWGLPTPTSPRKSTTTTLHDDDDNFDYYRQMQGDGRSIDSHQCESFVALLAFPPIGMIAMYHSWKVNSCSSQGQYSQAHEHARQASKYACLAKCVGIAFWIYWIFIRENDIEWPSFDSWDGWGD